MGTKNQAWAIILLLASLNLQQVDLKGQISAVRGNVGTVEKFLAENFESFKPGGN